MSQAAAQAGRADVVRGSTWEGTGTRVDWNDLLQTTPKVSCATYPDQGWRLHDLGWLISKQGWITFVKPQDEAWVAQKREEFELPSWSPVFGMQEGRFGLLDFSLTVDDLDVAFHRSDLKSKAFVRFTDDDRLVGTVVEGATFAGLKDDGQPRYRKPTEKALLFDLQLADITSISYERTKKMLKWWDSGLHVVASTADGSISSFSAAMVVDYDKALPDKTLSDQAGFATLLAQASARTRAVPMPQWKSASGKSEESYEIRF